MCRSCMASKSSLASRELFRADLFKSRRINNDSDSVLRNRQNRHCDGICIAVFLETEP